MFSYRPLNFYANADYTNFGDEYQPGEVCDENPSHCPTLEKPENIIGIQGHLWSETMRNPEMLLGQLFPRYTKLVIFAVKLFLECWLLLTEQSTQEDGS